MSVIYNSTVRTARLNVVASAVAAGDDPGVLQVGTAGMALVLYEIPLTDPPSVAGDVLTLLAAPAEVTAVASGTAAAARVRDSNDADVVTGLTVGLSDADVLTDVLAVVENQTVRALGATITHPSAP